MKKLNAQSVKSRQNSVLRYVASTNIEKTARDMNVSTRQLKSFLRANPKTVNPKNPLLSADAKSVAKQEDVKLVPVLRGKRLTKAWNEIESSERTRKAVRLASATRERRVVVEDGKRTYRPLKPTRVQPAREQIINNMSGMNQKSIFNLYSSGDISEDEAKGLMRKLYKNSGLSNARADSAWRKMNG